MIFIGIGGNLPSKLFGTTPDVLQKALHAIDSKNCRVVRCSPWYKSAPVPLTNQPDYLNAVVEVSTNFPANELLSHLHEVEKKFGRVRSAANASRIIDLDLISYCDHVIEPKEENGLCLPHPRLCERAFVLLPLFDLAPNWVHPVNNKSILTLKNGLPKNQQCERIKFKRKQNIAMFIR